MVQHGVCITTAIKQAKVARPTPVVCINVICVYVPNIILMLRIVLATHTLVPHKVAHLIDIVQHMEHESIEYVVDG